jgi:hypothetical protein
MIDQIYEKIKKFFANAISELAIDKKIKSKLRLGLQQSPLSRLNRI